MNNRTRELLELSHALGREDRALAILGEGNTSARLTDHTFAVKASGSSLGTLTEEGLTTCHQGQVLELLDGELPDDAAVENALLASRMEVTSRRPSTEALFHAWLLTLEGIHFVGHTHPVAVNSILCSPRAHEFASLRQFPDEIVCCGPESVLVPYTAPGVPLARAIQVSTSDFISRRGRAPRVILLQNHGLIALGQSPAAVLAATLMAEKAARIFAGAAALGGPQFLTSEQTDYIAGWPAEAYRQKVLGL